MHVRTGDSGLRAQLPQEVLDGEIPPVHDDIDRHGAVPGLRSRSLRRDRGELHVGAIGGAEQLPEHTRHLDLPRHGPREREGRGAASLAGCARIWGRLGNR
jgi:hypothetical protein